MTSQDRYGVIVADPPWHYRQTPRSSAARHYRTMTVEQLTALPVSALVAEHAVLFLWATWPNLPEALSVVSAWGFTYVSGFPWVKTSRDPEMTLFGLKARVALGVGWWVRGVSEPILICRRGRVRIPKNPYAGLLAKRLEHSRKPESIYAMAERFNGPYLELFARRRRAGWDAFGNEVEGSVTLEGG